jgi:putative aminopeptidase FrvX
MIMQLKNDFARLKKISETPGASGFEHEIRNLVYSKVKDYGDKVWTDNLGNLIVFKKGKSDKKVLVAAHMDEIGFIVNHVDDNGFLRFHPLGGFDPKTLTAQRVIVHGEKDVVGVMGSKPIHIMKPEERKKSVELDDFFIDTGLDAEEVKKIVEPGNAVTRDRELIEMGNCFNGKSMDNRISVYILEKVLELLKSETPSFDLYAVFTVQEEVGLRGAHVAAQAIEPDVAIGLDTTIAFDTPGSQPQEQVSKLGDGAAIKIMDASVISDLRMVDFFKKTAKRHQIKYQTEMLPAGGTDTGSLQRMVKGGSIAGALSIPTRHIHQVIESVHKEDVLNTVNLLYYSLLELDQLKMDYS